MPDEPTMNAASMLQASYNTATIQPDETMMKEDEGKKALSIERHR